MMTALNRCMMPSPESIISALRRGALVTATMGTSARSAKASSVIRPASGLICPDASLRNASSFSAIMAEKEEAFRRLASGQIKPLAGLMTLLALADRADVPMVAVTNAPRLNAEMMLSGLGIMQRFKAVIIGDELPHGKPHPLPYLEGLRTVRAAPELSLAFEDSRSGV